MLYIVLRSPLPPLIRGVAIAGGIFRGINVYQVRKSYALPFTALPSPSQTSFTHNLHFSPLIGFGVSEFADVYCLSGRANVSPVEAVQSLGVDRNSSAIIAFTTIYSVRTSSPALDEAALARPSPQLFTKVGNVTGPTPNNDAIANRECIVQRKIATAQSMIFHPYFDCGNIQKNSAKIGILGG